MSSYFYDAIFYSVYIRSRNIAKRDLNGVKLFSRQLLSNRRKKKHENGNNRKLLMVLDIKRTLGNFASVKIDSMARAAVPTLYGILKFYRSGLRAQRDGTCCLLGVNLLSISYRFQWMVCAVEAIWIIYI